MNARVLQSEIAKDIEALFSGDQFKTPELLPDDEAGEAEPEYNRL